MIEVLRIGVVKSVNADSCAARVEFDDLDGLVSAELPVLQAGCGDFQTYSLPNIGDQVLCAFVQGGEEEGYVIGAIYSDEDTPAAAGTNLRYIRFADGGKIEYATDTHVLTIDASGGVSINGPASISASVSIGGDLTVTGNIRSEANITAAGTIQQGVP